MSQMIAYISASSALELLLRCFGDDVVNCVVISRHGDKKQWWVEEEKKWELTLYLCSEG